MRTYKFFITCALLFSSLSSFSLTPNDKLGEGGNLSAEVVKTDHAVSGTIDGYDYVDMGLPSGKKWATCNYGASEIGEIGTLIEFNSAKDEAKKWGNKWDMPTSDDWDELYSNCTLTYVENYLDTDVAGTLFTSKINGNTLFIADAGTDSDDEDLVTMEGAYYLAAGNSENGNYIASIYGGYGHGGIPAASFKMSFRPVAD